MLTFGRMRTFAKLAVAVTIAAPGWSAAISDEDVAHWKRAAGGEAKALSFLIDAAWTEGEAQRARDRRQRRGGASRRSTSSRTTASRAATSSTRREPRSAGGQDPRPDRAAGGAERHAGADRRVRADAPADRARAAQDAARGRTEPREGQGGAARAREQRSRGGARRGATAPARARRARSSPDVLPEQRRARRLQRTQERAHPLRHTTCSRSSRSSPADRCRSTSSARPRGRSSSSEAQAGAIDAFDGRIPRQMAAADHLRARLRRRTPTAATPQRSSKALTARTGPKTRTSAELPDPPLPGVSERPMVDCSKPATGLGAPWPKDEE